MSCIIVDMVGQTVGLLTVIELAGVDRWGQMRWRCRCACGRMHVAAGGKLRRGEVKSCGCDKARRCAEANTKHGHSVRGKLTPEYRAWSNMIDRCERVGNKQYRDWGGRGIKVCKRWRNSFQAFLGDVGHRPSPNHTIGRIDNNGNYEPGNIAWQTRLEQCQNQRKNVKLTFKGETRCTAEWARRAGLQPATLWRRLKHGWSVERALTEPPH